jgi:hypothetical protein
MKDQKNLGLLEHIFIAFRCHLHVLICKKQALSVSHLTVTLRMMSSNRRSVSSISFEVIYSPDEEIDRDVTCMLIAAMFF